MAVKLTLVPAQSAPAGSAVITTEQGTFVPTVIVIAFETAGFPVTQAASEISVQRTTSLFARLVVVKVLLFVPAPVPFTVHW